jgi:arabinogalactan oligomer/maltooligosaccharide transport system substrate-binding protein
MGNSLGVAPLPQVSATGSWPAPYTSGKYFMIPKDVPEAKLATVIDFIKFATSYDNQIAMVQQLSRLPALREALADPVVSSDPILQKSAEQMSYGTPMPSVIEMRCNWDAMKPELNAVLSGTQNARAAANAMQQAAIACVDTL